MFEMCEEVSQQGELLRRKARKMFWEMFQKQIVAFTPTYFKPNSKYIDHISLEVTHCIKSVVKITKLMSV